MQTAQPLYIMLSRTDTGIGRVIRRLSHYEYNHVALTFDPTFRRWVSFGRFVENAAMFGGFIVEPVERYLAGGNRIDVRIFRVELPPEKQQKLQELFALAGDPDCGLLYNTFDILAAIFGQSTQLPDAYTCLGFACKVLDLPYKTIEELDKHLTPWLHFQGELAAVAPDTGNRDDGYFRRMSFPRKCWVSVRHIVRLSTRALRRKTHRELICLQ